ncbi:unnamed protein product [Blepharisma stoltei]|uniref:Kinesin-like protein n=1 Tax=Blepharisma stoltei TaxID=1481888 RepID=A0AAU9JMF1_9CILI|nr:unnamed protein product [Blepharisma stoltei]
MEEHADSDLGNIRVICRFRPLNEKEKEISMQTCIDFSSDCKTVTVQSHTENAEPLKFNFDHVFDPSSSQSSVYEISAKPIVEAVTQGFNGTIFAYGQTSSGKTFTMSGSDVSDPEMMGIIPRMVSTVFESIGNSEDYLEFQVKVSYCEIYMEKIKDLLEPNKNNLKIHEDRIRGIYISGLSEKYVNDDQEVYDLMSLGLENREVGYTHMNAGSSRSHSIFIITIAQSNTKVLSTKVGKLYLVDLAGSEKVGKTGAEGKRLEEAKNINKSLTTLGQVISALTDGKSTHVPYRDSKLTRVLQDSLGGNSKTTLIVTCSPSPYNESETISTLRFGIRAKAIKNKPKVNREYTVGELKILLSKAREEITEKNKRISELEINLQQSGHQIPDNLLPFGLNIEGDSSLLNLSKMSEYDEIFHELEDIRSRLSEEVQTNHSLSQDLSQTQVDLESLKSVSDYMVKELEKANNLTKTLKSDIKEKEEKIFTLIDTNEKLTKKNKGLAEKEFELKQEILAKEYEIDQLKEEIKKLQNGAIEKVIEKRIKTGWEDPDLEEGLVESTCSSEDKIKSLLSLDEDEIQRSATVSVLRSWELWNNEKKSFVAEIQNRTNSIISLNSQLDESKKKCKELEVALNQDERQMRIENKFIQHSLCELTKKFHRVAAKKSKYKIENEANEKKIKRLNDRCAELENKAHRYREKLKAYKFSIHQFNKQAELSRATISHIGAVSYSNIRKTIVGGSLSKRNEF